MKKNILNTAFLAMLIFLGSCGTQKEALEVSEKEKEIFNTGTEEPVEISDEESEYEIIIIEPGFFVWLQSIARPEGYYSQSFLESRNEIMVINWNQRVLQPGRFNPNLYELQINYDPQVDYGYEVNYKLYNYFVYFQRKYNQRLGPFFPRI
ncbi:hypothetical protein MTsPCn9_07560 [Croceitalea sp. MTPC9]|uniref:DUF6146 family protein n=1 Tax=unclassified Croceitalea TaxID=2632280 RepID=UPI002B3D6D9D|nr:hypothetical protein MTsPCn6_01150 [Croceitalea sp. MTPC6]GMN15820.1 hypothetical protein MTsPCn9_07560 [Croceitalea sp. MTPC9]